MKKYFFTLILLFSQLSNANSQILEASAQGDLSKVRKLVQKGEKIGVSNKAGETALIKAANGGHLELVQYLVSKRADINQRDKAGHTALFYSISNNYEQVSEFLIDKKAAIDSSLLFEATQLGSIKTVQNLIKMKSDLIHELNSENETALFEAVRSSQVEVARILLKAGINKNQKNKKGQLAADLADPKTDKKMLELLSAK